MKNHLSNVVIGFVLIALIIFIVFSLNDGDSKVIDQKNDVVKRQTVEEALSYHSTDGIMSTQMIGEDYLLVEHQVPTYSNKFYIHNLATGDVDVMPTYSYFVTLEEVINENHIVFRANGKNSESVIGQFPFLITCIRDKVDPDRIDDYSEITTDLYLPLGTATTSGSKPSDQLSEIVVTYNDIRLLFTPKPGQEVGFFAAETDIPVTRIEYDIEDQVFLVHLENADLDPTFIDQIKGINEQTYIQDVEVIRTKNDLIIAIRLVEGELMYQPSIKRTYRQIDGDDSLPYLQIEFKSSDE